MLKILFSPGLKGAGLCRPRSAVAGVGRRPRQPSGAAVSRGRCALGRSAGATQHDTRRQSCGGSENTPRTTAMRWRFPAGDRWLMSSPRSGPVSQCPGRGFRRRRPAAPTVQRRPRGGAQSRFTGYVRSLSAERAVHGMELEHYPGMTERSISGISRRPANAGHWRPSVVHRWVGWWRATRSCLGRGGVGASEAAFSAREFIMDYLKIRPRSGKMEDSQGAHG